jgi:hypothetical protein
MCCSRLTELVDEDEIMWVKAESVITGFRDFIIDKLEEERQQDNIDEEEEEEGEESEVYAAFPLNELNHETDLDVLTYIQSVRETATTVNSKYHHIESNISKSVVVAATERMNTNKPTSSTPPQLSSAMEHWRSQISSHFQIVIKNL